MRKNLLSRISSALALLLFALQKKFESRSGECQVKSAKFAAGSVIIHMGKCRLCHWLRTEQAAEVWVYYRKG